MKLKRLSFFTLAEVLVTLLIIGVVAAMTIPALMNKTQDAELKTAWKKAYSIVNQASLMVMNDNGGTFNNLCGSFDSTCLKNKYIPYFNTIKLCDSLHGAIYGICWIDTGYFLNGSTSVTDIVWDKGNSRAGAVLNNGMNVLFMQSYADGVSKDSTAYPIYGRIFIDVNGFAPPNIIGRDIFGIAIYENKISPIGIPGDTWAYSSTTCSTTNTGNNGSGWGCSALYLNQ